MGFLAPHKRGNEVQRMFCKYPHSWILGRGSGGQPGQCHPCPPPRSSPTPSPSDTWLSIYELFTGANRAFSRPAPACTRCSPPLPLPAQGGGRTPAALGLLPGRSPICNVPPHRIPLLNHLSWPVQGGPAAMPWPGRWAPPESIFRRPNSLNHTRAAA